MPCIPCLQPVLKSGIRAAARSALLLAAVLALLCAVRPAVAAQQDACDVQVHTLFAGTPHQLDAYILTGPLPGPTIMVQGGIQGDEPAGYLSAAKLARCCPLNGRLIVIPRANPPSIQNRVRLVNVDLNRRFDVDYNRYYEDILARAIRLYLAQADAFVHLHEGWGFHSPKWVNARRNPNRFGQSIVIDTPVFSPTGHKQPSGVLRSSLPIPLAEHATAVLKRLNPQINPAAYRFSLMSTDTFNRASRHADQLKSLTCYALTSHGIPAMAIEVSKDIRQLPWKVEAQLKATLLALERFGMQVVVPETDAVPKDEELLAGLSVNGQPLSGPVKLVLGQPLEWQRSGPARGAFLGVFAKDRRNVDLLTTPRSPMDKFEYLEVRSEGRRIGRVPVVWQSGQTGPQGRLVVWLNHQRHELAPGQTLDALDGDMLVLEGITGGRPGEVLNLKGFISDVGANDGQDAGTPIVLSPDMFRQGYVKQGKAGNVRCRVQRETPGQTRHNYYLRVHSRTASAVVLADEHGNPWRLPAGTNIALPPGRYSLRGVDSNGPAAGVQVLVDGVPVPLGHGFTLPRNGGVRISLNQFTTLAPLNVLDLKPSMAVQAPAAKRSVAKAAAPAAAPGS